MIKKVLITEIVKQDELYLAKLLLEKRYKVCRIISDKKFISDIRRVIYDGCY